MFLCLVPFFVTVIINMSNFMVPLTFLQSFVTHRILLCSSDDQPVTSNCENSSLYVLEWLLPRIGLLDKIRVKDLAGVACKIFSKTIALGGHSKYFVCAVSRCGLPELYVGKPECLTAIVRVMCEAAKKSMKKKKLHIGPWRKSGFMQLKWSGFNQTLTLVKSMGDIPANEPYLRIFVPLLC
ncbi:uncharacterized protein LOC130969853 [Arachis stenosperma]|uniref:uncharacterized protein LOC130969853 n=1 Tax=Arachis stenosperma TaxID=217475 RepID=UPI0025AD4D30|nr:uncharacterized protein LOC130969853 [Arachis stenosperma]XP_057751737.1 uncharacterized protein LOC130969853 [Arachis stenosperma]